MKEHFDRGKLSTNHLYERELKATKGMKGYMNLNKNY